MYTNRESIGTWQRVRPSLAMEDEQNQTRNFNTY
jgi:hypothetical protein